MTIGIIGFGRFGRLLAQNLKGYYSLYTYDKKDNKATLGKCDLVILCVPINSLEAVVREIRNIIKPGTIVMDVCSVKVMPARILKKYLKNNIIATHPLFGPDSAKNGFTGHKMVFCPLAISKADFNKVKAIFTKLGVVPIITTPREHDKMMAKTQALVHFLGRSLKGIKPQLIATPDYKNLMTMMDKVWNDTWELFFDMQLLNPYAKNERQKFVKNVLDINNKINKKTAD